MRHIRTDPARLDARWQKTDTPDNLRRHWERLLNRARFLDPTERTFLELAAEQNGRINRLACLTQRSAAALNRRLRDILRRLDGPELRAVIEHPDAFTPFEKFCIRQHLVRKHPIARLAADRQTTVYAARKALAAARAKARRLTLHNAPQHRPDTSTANSSLADLHSPPASLTLHEQTEMPHGITATSKKGIPK